MPAQKCAKTLKSKSIKSRVVTNFVYLQYKYVHRVELEALIKMMYRVVCIACTVLKLLTSEGFAVTS